MDRLNENDVEGINLKILRVEDILLDRLVMAQEWIDLQARVQAEMLMYVHEEIDWPSLCWNLPDEKDIRSFQKKVKTLREHIERTIATPIEERGEP